MGSRCWRQDPWLTAWCLQGQATPGDVRDALLTAVVKLHLCRCEGTCWTPPLPPAEGHGCGDVTAGVAVVPTLRH